MRCRRVHRKLSAFLDGELSKKQSSQIAEHLSRCSTCGQEAASLSSIWEGLEKMQEIDPSPYFWTRLSARIAQAEERRLPIGGLVNRLLVPATTIVALVVGLWIGERLYDMYGENRLEPWEQVTTSLHLDALDDFPAESIGLAYMELVSGQGE